MSVELLPPDGVPDWAWQKLAKVSGDRWAIDERNASGEVIGTAYRLADGSKEFKSGGKRGLIVAWPLHQYAGTDKSEPIFICEGASDTATLIGLGLYAVGIPMAGQCGDLLSALLKGLHVVLVADADTAGRNGTRKLEKCLVGKCASVKIIEPPAGAKDSRAAALAGATAAAFLLLAEEAQEANPEIAPIDGAPMLVRLCDVKSEPVEWLWPGRFAIGKLTIVVGDPGLGKSFVTLDMAARVSRGMAWPDAPGVSQAVGGVVLLNAEDGVADTIVPRLVSAGADLHQIISIDAIQSVKDGKASVRTFDLVRDLIGLERAIANVRGCRMVVIDPLTAYLGGTDSHNNADMRGLLAPLSELAARHRVAVIGVTHMNKSGSGPAIYRAMGSLAFVAAARAAWSVSKDKDDDKRRLFLPIKNNIAPDTGGLAYRIEAMGVGKCPIVAWEHDPVNVSADDALSIDRGETGGGSNALEEAKEWLRDMLSGEPCAAKDLQEQAKSDGIASRTLNRAKEALGVKSQREGYANKGRWVWAMPHTLPSNPKDATPDSVATNDKLGNLSRNGDDWGEV